jgi:hypothetical protein
MGDEARLSALGTDTSPYSITPLLRHSVTPIAVLPYCRMALLPYCPIALLPYNPFRYTGRDTTRSSWRTLELFQNEGQ